MPKQSRAVRLLIFGLVFAGLFFGVFQYTRFPDYLLSTYVRWKEDSQNLNYLLSKGKYRKTIIEADKKLKRGIEDPKDRSWILYRRGIAYGAMGNFSAALADYNQSTDHLSGFVPYSEWEIRSVTRGSDEGLELLNKLIAERPDVKLYSSRARFYIKKGQYDLAITDLRTIIELEMANKDKEHSPYPAAAQASLGHLYIKLGKYDEALVELSRASEDRMFRNSAEVLVNQAVAYGVKGNREKSISDYKKAAGAFGHVWRQI